MDEETYYVSRESLHSERVMKTISKKNGEEKVGLPLEVILKLKNEV